MARVVAVIVAVPVGVIVLAGIIGVIAVTVPTCSEGRRCEAAGGEWIGPVGFDHYECKLPTIDGGKPCSDSSECHSGCVTALDVPAGTKTRGRCFEYSTLLLECYNEVRKGKAQGERCWCD